MAPIISGVGLTVVCIATWPTQTAGFWLSGFILRAL